MVDIVDEFNKLRQTGSVENYQKRFEELRSLMIQHNPHPSETYFVSSYLSGLNYGLRPMVKVLKPQSMEQASLRECQIARVGGRSSHEEAETTNKGSSSRFI